MSCVDWTVLALRVFADDDGDWVVEAVEEASWRTLLTESINNTTHNKVLKHPKQNSVKKSINVTCDVIIWIYIV